MNTNAKAVRPPRMLWLSVAASVLIFPLLWLLERFSGFDFKIKEIPRCEDNSAT